MRWTGGLGKQCRPTGLKFFWLRLVGKASSRRFYVLPNTLGEEVVSWWAPEEPRPLLKCTSGTGAEASEEEPCLICRWNNTQIIDREVDLLLLPSTCLDSDHWLPAWWTTFSPCIIILTVWICVLEYFPFTTKRSRLLAYHCQQRDNSKGRFGSTLVCPKTLALPFPKKQTVEAIS